MGPTIGRGRRRALWEDYNIWPAFTDVIAGVFLFMVFFFIILIAKSYVDLEYMQQARRVVENVKNELEDVERFMKGIDAKVEHGTIILKSDILFPYDKSQIEDIPPEGQAFLKKVGFGLKNLLQKDKSLFQIVVEGHTDLFGSDNYNQKLSFDRAQTIVTFWDRNGFSSTEYGIMPTGFGKSNPKIRTGDIDQQAVNRRIEIRIYPRFARLLELTEGAARH